MLGRKTWRQAKSMFWDRGWLVLDRADGGGYGSESFVVEYVDEAPVLPPEVVRFREEIERRMASWRPDGGPAVWNGSRYYLRWFMITRAPDGSPRLIFRFGPSDYFNFLATSLNLNREFEVGGRRTTLRELYLAGRDPWDGPVDFLSHSFGISLCVVTRDGRMLVSRRSGRVMLRAGMWSAAVNEGLERPGDADESGRPDFRRAAVRGIFEELGPQAGESVRRLVFLSFGVDLERYQHGLLGLAELGLTAEEVAASRAGARDRWEGEIFAVPFDPEAFARFAAERGPWVPAALVLAAHSFMAALGLSSEVVVIDPTPERRGLAEGDSAILPL